MSLDNLSLVQCVTSHHALCSCHPNLGIHLLESLLQDDAAACTALCRYNISKYIYISLYIYMCVCSIYIHSYIIT